MSKRSPRLLFTDEELAAPELKKAIRKADKRMKKLEKAEAKIPKGGFCLCQTNCKPTRSRRSAPRGRSPAAI